MDWKIPLSDIDLGEDEIKFVLDVLRSKWLSMGPVTERFESEFSDYLGTKHSFAVSNGTAALHIAHKVLGLKPGDEVIVPSLTFVATANSVLYCGAKPVFADITSVSDLNISVEDILEKITPKTKAITVVHYGGYPCDMHAIMDIGQDKNIKIIEDAAHAPGAELNGKRCGSIGDIGCFSFFSNKNIATGEGGMISTNDDSLAAKIRIMRSHGMSTLTWDRHKGHSYSYTIEDLGYNYRLNEIASAIGIIQLRKLDKNNQIRRQRVDKYINNLKDTFKISIPFRDHAGTSSCHIFPILVSENVSRDKLILDLRALGIQTSIHYPSIHQFPLYKNLFKLEKYILPKTEFVSKHEITLPLHPLLTDEEIDYITISLERLI